jgi:lysophospholipase L1-like esterase
MTYRPEIVLLGDSNTIISYFAPFSNKRWSTIISKSLNKRIANLGKDGATTHDFLNQEKLNKIINLNAKYYIICFGINDEKQFTVDEFKDFTKKLINEIQNKTNGVPILMTNLYVDYPHHYSFNVDKLIVPFDEAKRELANEMNLHLIDAYKRFKTEASKGNWDIRIRDKALNDKKDAGKTAESGWFDNIHYNANGNKILADEIKQYFVKNNLA